MTGVALLHSGIALTVTGVSRCVSVDAYAAAGLLPGFTGVGVAVAYDAPVVAEACGLGAVAAVEEVDVKVSGRGLYYSSSGLASVLADLVASLYNGEETVAVPAQPVTGPRGGSAALRPELLAASLKGSTAIISGEFFPLGVLQGYWAVVVHLRRGLPRYMEAIHSLAATDPGRVVDITVDVIDEGVDALEEAGILLARESGDKTAVRLVKRAVRAGAAAAFLDYTGRLLVALAESYEEAVTVSASLRGLGDRFEGEVIA